MTLCQARPRLYSVLLTLTVIECSTETRSQFSAWERSWTPCSWVFPLTTLPVPAHAHEVPGLMDRSKTGYASLLIMTRHMVLPISFSLVQPRTDLAHRIQSVFWYLQTQAAGGTVGDIGDSGRKRKRFSGKTDTWHLQVMRH